MDKQVTAIKRQKKNSQRVNIYLDGEYAFALFATKAVGLHIGQCLSEHDIKELENKDTKQKAYSSAVRFISHRPRSVKEVRDSLKKKEFTEGVIDSTLDHLSRVGLLDDREFAKYWFDQRVSFKPRGASLLRHELLLKGVDRDVIADELDAIDEEEMAIQAARKWASRPSNLAKEDYKRKLSAFLARRGFKYSVVRYTVGRIKQEIDGIDKRKEM
jgi:regulatory protein